MPGSWYDSDEWGEGPAALAQLLDRVRRSRRNGDVYAMRKVARLFASGDPARREAAHQILTALIAEQEQRANPGTLLRERRAALLFQERRFAEAEADYRACIAIYRALGSEPAASAVDDDLGRVLVQSTDAAARAEGEARFQRYYAAHNPWGYRPYDELEPLLSYERPLARYGDDRRYVAAELIAIAYDDREAVRRGTAEAPAQLDAILFERPLLYAYKPAFLQAELLPELGAYLGNLLVRHQGGEWQHTQPLARSRVALGAERFNPFLAAFRAIYHFYPLRHLLPATG